MAKLNSLSFDSVYAEICHEIEKRRNGWTISSVDFDDVKQEILIHVNQKLYQFDPKKVRGDEKTGFVRWLNSLISSQISNARRNYLGRFSRPCIATPTNKRGCPFNSGGETCSETPSGRQCSECPIYARWEEKKMAQFAIKQTLPIENHVQEVHNVKDDFTDMAEAKSIIDKGVMERLTKQERKMYRMIYVQGKEPEEVGKLLGFKKVGHVYAGYHSMNKLKKKVVRLATKIIEIEGLA